MTSRGAVEDDSRSFWAPLNLTTGLSPSAFGMRSGWLAGVPWVKVSVPPAESDQAETAPLPPVTVKVPAADASS